MKDATNWSWLGHDLRVGRYITHGTPPLENGSWRFLFSGAFLVRNQRLRKSREMLWWVLDHMAG